jgi:putative inorganic carbon (HCO3(-)) transporter
VGILKSISFYLLKIEIFIVAGAIGLSMVFTRLLPIALLLTVIFWVIRWIRNGRPSRRTPADWGIALILFMGLIAVLVTALPEVTHLQIYRLLLGIGFYYAIINWTDSNLRLRFLLIAISLAGIALGILGLFSVQWTTTKIPFVPDLIYEYLPTLLSDIIHRNVMAGTLVILLPITIGLPLLAWKKFKLIENCVFISSTLIMTGVLILTQSRAGWMAFIASLGVVMLMGGKWTRFLFFLGISIGIILIFSIGIDPLVNAVIASNTIGGIDGRIDTWSRALLMIRDFPFTGVGMGSFLAVADTLYPFTILGPGTVEHAHNLFFQIGIDLGLPGLIGWLAIVVVVTSASWQLYKKGKHSNDQFNRALGISFFCCQIALCTHGILDAVTWGMVRPAPIVWAIWGLAIASGLRYLMDEQSTQNSNLFAEV